MTTHRDVLTAYVDAFNTGDLDAFDALVGDDYRNHDPLRPELAEGLDSLKTIVTDLRRMFPELRYEVIAVLTDGDLSALHTLVHGTADSPVRQIQIERFRDGRIVEHWRATNPAHGG